MVTKLLTQTSEPLLLLQQGYCNDDGLDVDKILLKFLKPILNGKGFDFKEPIVADERRMDLVIKRWYGEKYHQLGLQQLSDYLIIWISTRSKRAIC